MTWLTEAREWCRTFDQQWMESKSQRAFHDFALEMFTQRKWGEGFDLQILMQEVFQKVDDLNQLNPGSRFGEPPLTLYNSDRGGFVLDLYVWSDFHTSVHDHSFEGCFHVLQGSSLEGLFQFDVHESIGECAWGELSPTELRLLSPGQTRPIRPDRGTIHRVLHLERPTVSLALRTQPKFNHQNPQLTYRYGCLASPSHLGPSTIVRLRILDWAIQNGMFPQHQIQDLINYGELWERLMLSKKSVEFGIRLALAQDRGEIPRMLERESQFIKLLKEFESVEEMRLFTAFEFFGPQTWISWVSKHMGLNQIEAREKLKAALDKIMANQERDFRLEQFLLPLYS